MFKVGDKIVCVDPVDLLKLYKIYKIDYIMEIHNLIFLKGYGGYNSSRFISLSEFRKQKIEKIKIKVN